MPDTIVRLYSAVPIPRDLSHHIYSSSIADFESKLSDYSLKSYNALSYQRYQRSVKIEENVDFITDANYLEILQGKEIFFAFLDEYVYINDKTVELTYTIDPIATYLISKKVTLGQSFVERCHSKTDAIGDNLIPDAFGTNLEMVCSTIKSALVSQDDSSIVIQTSVNLNELNNSQGTLLEKTFTGIDYFTYGTGEIETLNSQLATLNDENKSDAIIKMYMFPNGFYESGSHIISALTGKSYQLDKNYEPFGDYVPKNQKIYTYPYNYLIVDNSEGDQKEYHYEYFDTDTCYFYCYPQISGTPSITLIPNGYYHSPETSFAISMDDFPQCAWSSDYYKAWLAQNSGAFAIKTLGSLALALGTGSTFPATIAVQSATTWAGETYTAQKQAPRVHSSGTNSAFWDMARKDFYFIKKRLNSESAKIVDSYWTMYGYPEMRVMDVPLHNRESYTYVKTAGCNASGNAPATFIDMIKNAFDRGITFWVTPDTMYKYDISNLVLT